MKTRQGEEVISMDGETAPLGGGPIDPIPTIDNPND
jgi:hypothetical protein